jgi:hypothetical protein
VDADHDARGDIHRQREPLAPHRPTVLGIDHHGVHERVVDLDDCERFGRLGKTSRHGRGIPGIVEPPTRGFLPEWIAKGPYPAPDLVVTRRASPAGVG